MCDIISAVSLAQLTINCILMFHHIANTAFVIIICDLCVIGAYSHSLHHYQDSITVTLLLSALGNYYVLPGKRDPLLCGNASEAG